jgi:hypothetical protein
VSNEIEVLFEDMIDRGLVTTGNRWIERATMQKNPRLTLELAFSEMLVYDFLDRMLIRAQGIN